MNMTRQLEGGIKSMCNVSQGIMEKLNLSEAEITEMLK